MLIKYKGGRSFFKVSLDRKPYYFTPENNHIADIQDQAVINYIFSLSNRAEFEVVMEEPKPETKPEIKEEVKEEPKEEPKIIKKVGRPKK